MSASHDQPEGPAVSASLWKAGDPGNMRGSWRKAWEKARAVVVAGLLFRHSFQRLGIEKPATVSLLHQAASAILA